MAHRVGWRRWLSLLGVIVVGTTSALVAAVPAHASNYHEIAIYGTVTVHDTEGRYCNDVPYGPYTRTLTHSRPVVTIYGWSVACYDDWVSITMEAALDMSTDQVRVQATIREFDYDIGYANPVWRTKWFPKNQPPAFWLLRGSTNYSPPMVDTFYGGLWVEHIAS
jgi:hypothetical protein